MKRSILVLATILGAALPALGQTHGTLKNIYRDVSEASMAGGQVIIAKESINDFLCTSAPSNPPSGTVRFYCDSGTGNMACLTSTGTACISGSLPALPTDALIRNLCEQGTGSASQPPFWCFPGLAPDIQTGVTSYTIPANDYGHYVMFTTQASPIAVTLPLQVNFYSFLAINQAVGTATFTPQSGQIWSGGSLNATVALLTGQACFFESDNTNWSCTIIAAPGAGVGTVTHTGGALTSGQLLVGNGAADIKVGNLSGDATTSGSAVVTVTGINGTPFPTSATIVGSDGSATPIAAATTGSGTTVVLATSPVLVTPTLGVALATSLNGLTTPTAAGSAIFAQRIASGGATLGTSAIASATCDTVVTVAATGVVTTDTVLASFSGDPTAVTGYIPATAGMLTIIAYPTANNVNFKVCNNTNSSITPGSAIVLNWIDVR